MHEVFWRGEKVGYVTDLGSDNFHVYGKWSPVEGASAEFLGRLEQEQTLVVRIGTGEPKLLAEVDSVPDVFLEGLARPNLSEDDSDGG